MGRWKTLLDRKGNLCAGARTAQQLWPRARRKRPLVFSRSVLRIYDRRTEVASQTPFRIPGNAIVGY